MFQIEEDSPLRYSPSQIFHDIHFALLGFDPIEEPEVRSKLVNGGGVDIGKYGAGCTHLIIDKIVYDDPICVAARSDEKVVVTALWVDYSLDVGVTFDPSLVLFRPVKDLNGIPGAKSLCICLTGYQRQYRDDIMIMAGLMGASFSKPLVPNKVTHLICYDFESQKYQLAKMMKKIKLVNHRWLEDCLKAWEILPESSYNQSGYELEMMEAEAKDSEEETEDRNIEQFGERNVTSSRNLSGSSISKASVLVKQLGEVAKPQQTVYAPKILSDITKDIGDDKRLLSTPGKESNPAKAREYDRNKKSLEKLSTQVSGACCGDPMDSAGSFPFGGAPELRKESSGVGFNQMAAQRSPQSEAGKRSNLCYMRKTPMSFPVSVSSETSSHIHGRAQANNDLDFEGIIIENKDIHSHHGGETSALPMKRKATLSVTSSIPPTVNLKTSAKGIPSTNTSLERYMMSPLQMKSSPSPKNNCDISNQIDVKNIIEKSDNLPGYSNSKNKSLKREPLGKKILISESTEFPAEVKVDFTSSKSTAVTSCGDLKHSTVATNPGEDSRESKLDNFLSGRTVESQKQQKDGKISCINIKNSESNRTISPGNHGVWKRIENETSSRILTKKTVAKRTSGSRPKLSLDGANTNKGSLYVDKHSNEGAMRPEEGIEGAEYRNTDGVKPVVGPKFIKDANRKEKMKGVLSSANKVQDKIVSMDDDTEAPEQDSDRIEIEKRVEIADPISRFEESKTEKLERTIDSADGIDEDSASTDIATIGCGKDVVEQEKAIDGKETEAVYLKEGEQMTKRRKLISSKNKDSPIYIVKQTASSGKDKVGVELQIKTDVVKMKENAKRVQLTASKRKSEALSLSKTKKAIDAEDEMSNSNEDLRERRKHVSHKSKNIPVSVNKEREISAIDMELDKCKKKFDEKLEVGKVKGPEHPAKKKESKVISVNRPVKPLDAGKKSKTDEKTKVEKTKGVDKPEISRYAEENENNSSEMMEVEKAKQVGRPESKSKSKALSVHKPEKSVAVKDNKPIGNGDLSVDTGKNRMENAAFKSSERSMKVNSNFGGTDLDKMQSSDLVCSEPVWFFLSGSRPERKEFRKVIRQLKGRLCRDSHHWSYQATHFIVPDPVRRTEKFFAAAASGRWILKTEYLTASNQARTFLAEEPYEWFRNGLIEDGAINLEAPRKWRLLRERTGHGAFYGMRIIIYGECFTPPLDTLKRVIKAGDGTILATAPPYTRFLKSDVDYAIVSSTMPRVDSWVQEFLRHEIPCIAADYLVDFVCKPGYSLEKHVLYNTHAWAEKSFNNLLSRSEEIYEVSTPKKDDGDFDISCEVCGSDNRGEVLLICGSEDGSLGCGIGTHIDCCDPPLEAVPEEDWFCAKCSETINNTKQSKGSKKKSSVSKRK
ncbi:hypothetical protein GIB67_022908 [Kingdonia uniflora]|uniref:BRCT domain-containing protein n=1 Tax=Kingdonia uniflora TaxID=39325 RepID=A0A7J7KW81_9MAGN|nr:hypothetical protein GIB67_022908 [Kingdonia uniflora]